MNVYLRWVGSIALIVASVFIIALLSVAQLNRPATDARPAPEFPNTSAFSADSREPSEQEGAEVASTSPTTGDGRHSCNKLTLTVKATPHATVRLYSYWFSTGPLSHELHHATTWYRGEREADSSGVVSFCISSGSYSVIEMPTTSERPYPQATMFSLDGDHSIVALQPMAPFPDFDDIP